MAARLKTTNVNCVSFAIAEGTYPAVMNLFSVAGKRKVPVKCEGSGEATNAGADNHDIYLFGGIHFYLWEVFDDFGGLRCSSFSF